MSFSAESVGLSRTSSGDGLVAKNRHENVDATLNPLTFPLLATLVFAGLSINAIALLDGQSDSQATLGVAISIYGLAVFALAGNRLLTAVSLWGLSVTLFLGVALIILPEEQYFQAVSGFAQVAFNFHLLTTLLALLLAKALVGVGRSGTRLPILQPGTLFRVGTVASIFGMVALYADVWTNVTRGFFWVGPLLIAASAGIQRQNRWKKLLFIALLVMAYVQLIWSGDGRLTLFSMFVGGLVAFQVYGRLPAFSPKLLVILLFAPMVALGGNVGNLRGQDDPSLLAVTNVGDFTDGLVSLWRPLVSGSMIYEVVIDTIFQPNGLGALFASLFVWVPRAFWRDKPEGLGREVLDYLYPGASEVANHSTAVLEPGEFMWMAGGLGFLLGLPIVALILGLIESRVLRLNVGPRPVGATFAGIFWCAATATVVPLYWSGTFVFTGRILTQLLALALLTGVLLALSTMSPKPGSSRRSYPHR